MDEFVKKAAEMGQAHLAISDHGSLRCLYEFAKSADEHGVHAIPAIEMYLSDNAELHGLTDEEKTELKRRYGKGDEYKAAKKKATKDRQDRDHITVWATNDVGLKNLFRLTAWSWGRGFYQKPRIDTVRLRQFSEGLAVSTGCPGGVVAQPLRDGRTAIALERFRELADIFQDRLLVEVMPHVPEQDCTLLASKLYRLADRFGASVIATQDAHYPHENDGVAQDALLCIHTKGKMSDAERFHFHAREYWLTTRQELVDLFVANPATGLKLDQVNHAIDNTMRFAERCTAKVEKPRKGAYLPAPELPPGVASHDSWLLQLCTEGVAGRFPQGFGEEYRERLAYELRILRSKQFAPYMIMVAEAATWMQSQGIFLGPRGSVGGSLVAYLLGITDLDAVHHGLSFDRFVSPARVEFPDADLDVESSRREEVISHLRSTYGEDRVAHVSTIGRLGGKATVRDLGRIFDVPERDVSAIATLVADNPYEEEAEDTESLKHVLEDTQAGRDFAERYPDVAAVAGRLQGMMRNSGLHAGGIVISSEPLADIVPMETRSRKGQKKRVWVTAYDMAGVEEAGLVKVDVLGSVVLDILARAFGLAGATPAEVDVEDENVLRGFTDGRFAGVFQYDTPSARRLCRGFTFKQFSDVAVMTALNRPGPAKSGLAAQYVARAANPKTVRPVDPIYDDVFGETFGVPVFQEQVISFAKRFAGYDSAGAEEFRKKIAKKKGLSDEEPKFLDGAVANGASLELARKLFGQMVGFASYAFNRAHSTAYAQTATYMMWLKTYFPAEFYAAALTMEDKEAKRLRIAAEARKYGIAILPPDVNLPGDGFQIRNSNDRIEIVGSISDIKGIGPAATTTIAAAAPFESLHDFRLRAVGRGVNAGTFAKLARANAFASLFPHHRFLTTNASRLWSMLRTELPVLDPASLPDYDNDEGVRVVSELWPLYVDVSGRGSHDHIEAQLRAACRRDIHVPGELDRAGGYLLVGRLAGNKVFPGDDGKRMARIVLASADGDEIAVRVEADVLDRNPECFEKLGKIIAGLVVVSDRITFHGDVFWTIDQLLDPGSDTSALALVRPEKTSPRDPTKHIANAEPRHEIEVEGTVVRVRRHADKNKAPMRTVGLLTERSYVRFFVFATRRQHRDVDRLKEGAHVRVRLSKLEGNAVCLSDRPVTVVE